MSDEPVLVNQDGAVVTLILNRPEKLNAWGEGMREALTAALTMVAREPALRVAVITGAGRGFCAGGDINLMIDLIYTLVDPRIRY